MKKNEIATHKILAQSGKGAEFTYLRTTGDASLEITTYNTETLPSYCRTTALVSSDIRFTALVMADDFLKIASTKEGLLSVDMKDGCVRFNRKYNIPIIDTHFSSFPTPDYDNHKGWRTELSKEELSRLLSIKAKKGDPLIKSLLHWHSRGVCSTDGRVIYTSDCMSPKYSSSVMGLQKKWLSKINEKVLLRQFHSDEMNYFTAEFSDTFLFMKEVERAVNYSTAYRGIDKEWESFKIDFPTLRNIVNDFSLASWTPNKDNIQPIDIVFDGNYARLSTPEGFYTGVGVESSYYIPNNISKPITLNLTVLADTLKVFNPCAEYTFKFVNNAIFVGEILHESIIIMPVQKARLS